MSDNLITALQRRDRVRKIITEDPSDSLWEQITTATVMQGPFPELTSLRLVSPYGVLPLPDTFLNGSASRLQDLFFWAISFPSLPTLLLSATDLTSLFLVDIPNSAYIPPETMATCLSTLTKLKCIYIDFKSPTPHPNRPVPPPTRSVLPFLCSFSFQGVSEYLEVLAAQIDAPHLSFDHISITFFNQPVFDIPQTIRFLGHLKSFRPSSLTLRFNPILSRSLCHEVVFFPTDMRGRSFSWHIKCETLNQQVVSITQICSQILSFRTSVESLVIEYSPEIVWPLPTIQADETDPTQWLQLFHIFPLVQSLQIPASLEPSISVALEGLTGESVAELFPSLHDLSIVGCMSDDAASQGIRSYVGARRHSGCAITVSFHHK
jgi:hypothetical protein